MMEQNCEQTNVELAMESEAMEKAWLLFAGNKKNSFLVVQVAPAVRVAIGEKFGFARGEDGVGKLAAVLSALGADAVVDTAAVADAVTLIRAQALKTKKESGATLPVFSSECAVWVAYAKENYPEIAEELAPSVTSVCAKLLKKYYSKTMPNKTIRVIALEAGEAKKAELGVDVVLSLDELTSMLEYTDINLRLVKKMPLDVPFGVSSGVGYVAAASGGDAESVARCLIADKTQNGIRKLEYSGLYGKQARREAEIAVGGTTYKFAVVDSLIEADSLVADVQAGKAAYDYVEVTACKGGPIGVGCEEDGMTYRLRKLGLKYLDQSRAARSADSSPTVSVLLKAWNALCRSGEAEQMNEIEEIVYDPDPIIFEPPIEEESIVEEVFEEPIVEEVVEESIVEEVVEEPIVEEVVEEFIVEEVLEEPIVEEVVEEPIIEEEVVEEIAATEAPEETMEETLEVQIPVEEVSTEETLVEEKAEDSVEEIIEETEEERRKKDPYYWRMSTKERRKLKRMKNRK